MDLPSKLSSDNVTLICDPVILRPQLVIQGNGTVSTGIGNGYTQDGISTSFKVRYRDHKDTLFIPMEVMLLKSIMNHTQKMQENIKNQFPIGQENIPQNSNLGPLQPILTPRNKTEDEYPEESPRGLLALKSIINKTGATPLVNPCSTSLKSVAPKVMVVDLGTKNRDLVDLMGGNEGRLRTKQLLGTEYQLVGGIERKGQGKSNMEIWIPFVKVNQSLCSLNKTRLNTVNIEVPVEKQEPLVKTTKEWIKFIPGMTEEVDSKEVASRVRYLFYVAVD